MLSVLYCIFFVHVHRGSKQFFNIHYTREMLQHTIGMHTKIKDWDDYNIRIVSEITGVF